MGMLKICTTLLIQVCRRSISVSLVSPSVFELVSCMPTPGLDTSADEWHRRHDEQHMYICSQVVALRYQLCATTKMLQCLLAHKEKPCCKLEPGLKETMERACRTILAWEQVPTPEAPPEWTEMGMRGRFVPDPPVAKVPPPLPAANHMPYPPLRSGWPLPLPLPCSPPGGSQGVPEISPSPVQTAVPAMGPPSPSLPRVTEGSSLSHSHDQPPPDRSRPISREEVVAQLRRTFPDERRFQQVFSLMESTPELYQVDNVDSRISGIPPDLGQPERSRQFSEQFLRQRFPEPGNAGDGHGNELWSEHGNSAEM